MSYSRDVIFQAPTPAPSGGYRVRYRLFGSSDAYTTVTGPGSPITLNNLIDGASYEGVVESICGPGQFSIPVPFTFQPPTTTTTPATTTSTTSTTSTTTTTTPVTVQVLSNLSGATLTSLTNILGYTLPETVNNGESFTGQHSSFTSAINFTVTAAPDVDGSIVLSKNGVIVGCINLAEAGTYPFTSSFASDTYNSTDVIRVELQAGLCTGAQVIYVGAKSSAGVPDEATILSATQMVGDPLTTVFVNWQPFNATPQYCYVAIPDIAAPKVYWYTDVLNQGTIGNPGDLFDNPTMVTVAGVPYNVYITNWQTQFVQICQLRITTP